MHLWCSVCGEVQPVNTADEADEDPRTQNIRRSFRTEHVATCGVGAVAFRLHAPNDPAAVDFSPRPWMMAAPEGITLSGDGHFYTAMVRDGEPSVVRVCEDCWQPIPRYIDFPVGLTSPESDKVRATHVEDKAALEHLSRAVCLPCYLAAFARAYPEAPPPPFRDDVFGDVKIEARAVQEHVTTIDGGFASEPKS